MKFNELPQEWQASLSKDRLNLHQKNYQTPYEILMYNEDGTRYFFARRCVLPSRYMRFGGGSYLTIAYGAVQFRACRNCLGGREYELCKGKRYCQAQNGTEIPSELPTKKEVLEVLTKIGIF